MPTDLRLHKPGVRRVKVDRPPDVDIVVGVPCYKDGPMCARCLDSLAEPGVQIIVVDNGADADVKAVLEDCTCSLIRNEVNRYVNPAWNQLMEAFLALPDSDVLVLANSDLVMDPGWATQLRAQLRDHRCSDLIFGVDAQRRRSSLGTFFAMSRRAVSACHPIPDDLLVLGGDDFMFSVILGMGWDQHVLAGLTMSHVERGTFDKSPEVWAIATADTARWHAYVSSELVPQRIAERRRR